jgi:hypothetical protein
VQKIKLPFTFNQRYYDEDSVPLEYELRPFVTFGTENTVAQRPGPEERTAHSNRRKNLETRTELEERHESSMLL